MRLLFKLFLLTILAATIAWWDAGRLIKAPLPLTQPLSFDIEAGSSLQRVLQDMDEQGLLPAARLGLYLRLKARLEGNSAAVKAGEYSLQPGMNVDQALALFFAGKTRLHDLRIVEGWTFAQAMIAVRSHPMLRQTLPVTASADEVMAAIGAPGQHPEGRLFPDTYHFPKGTSDVAFLRRAHSAMAQELERAWAQREPDLPYATPDEALTMASIVEKETGVPEERAQIAGVFVRRLRLGMRLQTDPTVIYGIGQGFDGNIRRNDLIADTPYNTYTRDGLPPTPICLPGRAAIEAALHPQPGTSIFFVSRGDGSHQFSDTLEQHNAAVRRYQLGKP
jgi:UPF0755 protein